MTHDRRSFLQAGGLAAFGLLGSERFADVPVRVEQADEDTDLDWPEIDVRVTQDTGSTSHWVLPGRRQLSEYVFGTPDNPKMTSQHWIDQAEGPVKEFLEEQPTQVGLPVELRRTNSDGTEFTIADVLTGFSDAGQQTESELDLTYMDRQPWDTPGLPDDTRDTAEVTARFNDPAGNEYEVELEYILQPPFPPWETGGGVVTGTWLHGVTGTGTPLMPRLFNYAALWGVGNLLVNGEVAGENRLIHFMTTENVRKADSYGLALDEELPLSEDERFLGHPHHTHLFVPPIEATPEGPVSSPVPTEFELPNGETQPFIHYMWDEDVIEEVVIREGNGETPEEAETQDPSTANVTFGDQQSDGSEVTVESASVPDGGFVVVHDESLVDRAIIDSMLGQSAFLEPGVHRDVTVELDDPLEESQRLIAVLYRDENENEEYDFVTSNRTVDGPYTREGQRKAVHDFASITVGE